MRFTLEGGVPQALPGTIAQVALLAALCAGVGILLCVTLHRAGHWWERLVKNSYLRIAAGGLMMALQVSVFGLTDLAGAGGHMI